MKYYKKVDNCGPVPYPDQSGKMLTTEVVSGPGWDRYVALGYVVEVEHEKESKLVPAVDAKSPDKDFRKTSKSNSKLNKLREQHQQRVAAQLKSEAKEEQSVNPDPVQQNSESIVPAVSAEDTEIKES